MALSLNEIQELRMKVENEHLQIKTFSNPDKDFYYSDEDNEKLLLWDGVEVVAPDSVLSDEEIVAWYREQHEELYSDEDDSDGDNDEEEEDEDVSISDMRKEYTEIMTEFSQVHAPWGRAYHYFQTFNFSKEIFDALNMWNVEYPSMDSSFVGTYISSESSIVALQLVLERLGIRANFNSNPELDVTY